MAYLLRGKGWCGGYGKENGQEQISEAKAPAPPDEPGWSLAIVGCGLGRKRVLGNGRSGPMLGEVQAMAGSKGGKHSKGKGKSKSKKFETSHEKPEAFNSKLDQAQISNNKSHGPGGSKGKNPKSQTKDNSRYTESELVEFLYIKLEDTYTRAKNWLLSSGYGMADVERAILNGRHFHGPLKELTNNILTNSVAFIEQKEDATGEAFKDMSELYKTMLETLVDLVLHAEPNLNLQRTDSMWLLLVRSWGRVPPTTTTSHLQSGDQNTNSNLVHGSYGSASHSRNEDASAPDSSSAAEKVPSELDIESSSKKVGILERINLTPALVSQLRQTIPILTAAVQGEIGASVIEQHDIENVSSEISEGSDIVGSDILTFIDEACLKRWLESCPNDPRVALIVDLMKRIRNLQEKVKVQKEWAQQKVIDSAKRLSKDLLELKILKMEKVEAECRKDEKLHAEQSCMVMLRETEQSLRNVNCEASLINETIRTLEISNAQIRADTEALKLSASEYEGDLNEVLNKERRCMKKISNFKKHNSNFRAQCDEEKQRVLQLELEVFQAEKEAEESETKWRQEIKEKEQMLAFLAEETRRAEIRKAKVKAQLAKLRQKLEIDSQLKRDQHQRLEDELSRLRLFHQSSDISLEGDNFLYNGVEVTSLESNALYESSANHWKCMICTDNEVCVVLLPCTHQVLCARCYEENLSTVRGRCPYCLAEIQQGIKVFGPSS